jgi:hypothetical protein
VETHENGARYGNRLPSPNPPTPSLSVNLPSNSEASSSSHGGAAGPAKDASTRGSLGPWTSNTIRSPAKAKSRMWSMREHSGGPGAGDLAARFMEIIFRAIPLVCRKDCFLLKWARASFRKLIFCCTTCLFRYRRRGSCNSSSSICRWAMSCRVSSSPSCTICHNSFPTCSPNACSSSS